MTPYSLVSPQIDLDDRTVSPEPILDPTESLTADSDDALPDKAASNEAQSLDRSISFILDGRDDTSLSSIPASQSAISSTTLAVSESKVQSCSIDGHKQARSTGAAVEAKGNSEQQAIYWKQAGYMFILAFNGAALAIGHHIYYSKLDGTLVASASHQQWAIRFGTAFSFLVQSCLQSSTVLACGQCVWRVLRSKSLTIGGIDDIFALTSSPSSFLQWELYNVARPVLLVALLTW